MRSGRSRFTLATLPAVDFPKIEGGETDVVVSVAQANLHMLIDGVGFAMAQQDVRYFLNGMLFEVTEDHLRTVATDGHRLALTPRLLVGLPSQSVGKLSCQEKPF